LSAHEELVLLSAVEAATIALVAFSVKRRKMSQTIWDASVVPTSPPKGRTTIAAMLMGELWLVDISAVRIVVFHFESNRIFVRCYSFFHEILTKFNNYTTKVKGQLLNMHKVGFKILQGSVVTQTVRSVCNAVFVSISTILQICIL